MASSTVSWTDPVLCHYNYDMTRTWFVYFDFSDHLLGQTVRKQFRSGINKEKRKAERVKLGNTLITHLRLKLTSGWNPIREQMNLPAAGSIPSNIDDAIQYVLKLKKTSLKPKSYRNYCDISGMFCKWAKAIGYSKLRLSDFTNTIGREYMDYLLIDKGYSGKTHNGQLGIMKAICGELVARYKRTLPENPFAGIATLPENTGRNVAYTEDEARALMKWLKIRDERMYFAANIMFHCYIRKTELCELKVREFNWDEKTITIASDSAKNRKQDSVTMTEDLFDIALNEMKLKDYPGHYYVFGDLMATTEGKISKPDILSDRHKRYVDEIKELAKGGPVKLANRKAAAFMYEYEAEFKLIAGLTTDKTFYSWKHTGVVMYWKVVKDVYYMMRQLRHHDMQTTMVYLKSLGLMPNEAFRNARVSLK